MPINIEREIVPLHSKGLLERASLVHENGSSKVSLALHFSDYELAREVYDTIAAAISEGGFRLGPLNLRAPSGVRDIPDV